MGTKCPERISRSGHLLFALHSAKHQLAVFRIDGNCRTGLDAALQNLLCKQRFHCMLHIPAQRTRAELRIVGRVDDELFCSLRQLTTQLLVGQTAVERRDLQVDDTGDVLFRQRLIEYNLIQTVEELRSERAVQKRLYLFLGLVRDLAVRADAVQQILAAKIRRQMIIVFLKSTVLPCESVMRPSSST